MCVCAPDYCYSNTIVFELTHWFQMKNMKNMKNIMAFCDDSKRIKPNREKKSTCMQDTDYYYYYYHGLLLLLLST